MVMRGSGGRRIAPTVICAAIVAVLSAGCGGRPEGGAPAQAPAESGGQQGAPAPQAKAGAETGAAPAGSVASPAVTLPEGYRVVEKTLPAGSVALVSGAVVTGPELQRRMSQLTEMLHQQRATITGWKEMALRDTADTILVKGYVEKLAARSPRAGRMRRQGQLLALSEVYLARDIFPKIQITPEQVALRLPRSRDEVFMRFLPFDPAREDLVLADLKAGVPFEQLQRKHSTSGEGMGLHGDIGYSVRGKTFFSEEDEAYLWGLKKGSISRPVASPIGPMIVRVEDRRSIDDGRWRTLEEDARQKIASERSGAFIQGLLSRRTIKLNHAGVREAAASMAAGDRTVDRLAGTVDGIEVWFYDLDAMLDESFGDIYRTASADELRNHYNGLFSSVAEKMAIGLEAEEAGFPLGEAGERKLELFLRQAATAIMKEDAIAGATVGEEEVRAIYEDRRKNREGDERFVIALLQAPDLGTALALRKSFESGTPFEKLHELAAGKVKPGREYEIIRRGLPEPMLAEVDQMRAGQAFTLFPRGGIYNFAILRDRRFRSMPPLAEVRGDILRWRKREKGQEALQQQLAALRNGVTVELDRAQYDAVPEPKTATGRPAMPMGHGHGGGGSPAGAPR